MHLPDLERILDPAKYPRDRHPFLLDLMRKFELCFSFPDHDDHYLLPDLLDKQQPEIASSLNQNLAFEFGPQLPKRASGKVMQLNVQELLNGVDLEGTLRFKPMLGRTESQILVFVSYSHKDDELRSSLVTDLKLFQCQGLILLWHDRLITAGQEWKGQIDDNLVRAGIILLLVSADFIASDYCYDIEMELALARHQTGEARVIPIIIRDVKWQQAPFGKLQALPKDGKAITLCGPTVTAPGARWRTA